MTLIQLALEDFPVSLLLLGLLMAALSLATTNRQRTPERVASTLLRWYLVCAVGVAFFVRFLLHGWFAAMPQQLAQFASDPSQLQITAACLGFALVGLFAAFGGLGLRLAAILGPAVFLWGTALAAILQASSAGARHEAGAAPFMDVLIPVIGFALLGWQAKAQSRRSVFARSRL